MKVSPAEIRYRIVRKMVRHKYWGRKHTSIKNIPKGFPLELRRDVIVQVKKLIREGIILTKPTHYGLEVSLNPRKIHDIENITRGK